MARDLKLERVWRERVSEQRASSLSVAEFCRGRGLPIPSFHYWRRELERRDREKLRTSAASSEFVPVTVVASTLEHPVSPACHSATTAICHSSPIEIHLADGRRVSVSQSCNSSLLAMVLGVLEGREGRSC